MRKITNRWTYRISNSQMLGTSIQVYNEDTHRWTHLFSVKPTDLAKATARWNETIRGMSPLNQQYDTFSVNNLIEVSAIMEDAPDKEIKGIIKDVLNILQLELEVI